MNRFTGAMLSGMMAIDNSLLETIGFKIAADGSFDYPTKLVPDEGFQATVENDIVPDMCTYVLKARLGGKECTFPMRYKDAQVGHGTTQNKVTCTPSDLSLTEGENVHIAIVITVESLNKMSTSCKKTATRELFSGTFAVPESENDHPLGQPGGDKGFMVQINHETFLFVTREPMKITYQGHW